MQSLLTESCFSISESNGYKCLTIESRLDDGIARIGKSYHNIILTEYGLDSLEKNLMSLLSLIHEFNEKTNKQGKLNGR